MTLDRTQCQRLKSITRTFRRRFTIPGKWGTTLSAGEQAIETGDGLGLRLVIEQALHDPRLCAAARRVIYRAINVIEFR